MARPKKYGLDYFPFDVDFFSDEKIGAISGEFGIKGEITVVKLLCAIYRNGYFILWDEVLRMKLLKDLPGISIELLDKIVNRLVKWGFFEQDMFSTARVLTSRGIQERYFEAIKRRKDIHELPYMLVNVCRNPINVYNNSVNVCENPQSKGKKKENSINGVKENPINTDFFETPLDECFSVLSGNQSWAETVTMNTRIAGYVDFTLESFHEWLKQFFAKLANEGETRKSPRDAMAHFARWLNQELEKQKKNAGNSWRSYTSKQEANEYAIDRLREHKRELEEGMAGEVERPF